MKPIQLTYEEFVEIIEHVTREIAERLKRGEGSGALTGFADAERSAK